MSLLTPPPPSLGFKHPAVLLSTWFGAGLMRPAPGTWGSLAALPFAWLLVSIGGTLLLAFATILVFAAGVWSSGIYEEAIGGKDPGAIVIDEVAGQWLTLLMVPLSFPGYLIGFILFRVFDILKPWPVSVADRELEGGLGIMADDIVAGLYAAGLSFILFTFLPLQ